MDDVTSGKGDFMLRSITSGSSVRTPSRQSIVDPREVRTIPVIGWPATLFAERIEVTTSGSERRILSELCDRWGAKTAPAGGPVQKAWATPPMLPTSCAGL